MEEHEAPREKSNHDDVETELKMDPDAQFLKKKQAILEACERKDLDRLRFLAESPGGFLSDAIRQQTWPILLGIPVDKNIDEEHNTHSWKELPRHRDEDQVQLDVNRAFVYYPSHSNEDELSLRKEELSALIVEVLRRYPYLCYFQGYHDICQVLLLVLPLHARAPAVARLSALRIRDFMLPSIQPAIAQLRLIPDILRAADPALWRHLSGTEPFFALSGTLTMYAHDITTLGEITRLFDALLAREPIFSVYMFAAIVRSRRAELFDTPPDEPEMLHSILSKLPVPLDLDALIAATADLFRAHPPERLRAWRHIGSASVLRTAHDSPAARAVQTMADGKAFFEKQVRALEWLERKNEARRLLWLYRGPLRTIALAILVGVAAVWLRRSPGALVAISLFFKRWKG